ncbi:MAG: orotidine-5'-phosphate decarboxylase [Methanobacteriaceae archaeon]|nr:orotidine-5'-phosphate decarboxylase [Methanobacteriaceae archaeon]
MKIKNKIILALDVQEKNKAYEILDELKEDLNTIKIGYPLVLNEGPEIITKIKEKYDFKIITDFKVADIPATNEKIVNTTLKKGADAIIVHGFTGKDSIKACLDTARENNKEIFLLTEMSHPGADLFLKGASEKIAEIGKELEIKNYVAPATKIDRLKKIREIVGKDAYIISPGVGFQGGSIKNTLKYANAAIIGRSIYNSNSPKEKIHEFIELSKN